MKPYPAIRQVDDDSCGRAVFELVEDFAVDVPVGLYGSLCVSIPAGTRTDFASVPQWLWWSVNPLDRHLSVAALLHDGLYAKEANCSRSQADSVFRFVSDWYGAGWWEQWKAYYALRLFGWIAYRRARRAT